ncbi:MAG: hypothetical protein DRJ31_07220 [Candidatus Methanomethylicota archaeon]|uniref:Glutaredoxin domain-containing protein n=1 Tax=Thermoproteota archaeon TaxID=2056631 RepID=A0A497EXK7_9CREN|nr:MAG: hypothetical protein DRJ31_07220 [Candidatus Verstraetearchaeota archaeon]RLE51859.1 MAG: hypothetical protein DRJ33_05025 [Candidatus Verstraetearchaeota archaeon]
MKKVELFKTPTCVKCPITKKLLAKILSEKGLSYEDYVVERDVTQDSDAMAELLMLNALTTPVVRFGDIVLYEEDAVKEDKLREVLRAAGAPV